MLVGARLMLRETTASQTARSPVCLKIFQKRLSWFSAHAFKMLQKTDWFSLQGFESGKRSAETADGDTGRAKRTKSEEET